MIGRAEESVRRGLAYFAIVGGNGEGITAADPVLYHAALVQVRWPSPAWTQDFLKMSDPPATIAKRPRPPVSRAPREQRRSG